jgi:Na+/H+ antiporter NhaD/arsenite permease-like protein
MQNLGLALAVQAPVLATTAARATHAPSVLGVATEFILFGLTLLGVALLHRHTLQVALVGLSSVLLLKLSTTHLDLLEHTRHELPMLANLFGLLLGFGILAHHFEESKLPEFLPRFLPSDWRGGLLLLFSVMVISSFLDNIAAALIGGTMARVVFRGKVHVGFLAAIIAASNAGGAGSVVGDTTTTMMWIEGVPALHILPAFVGSLSAFACFGVLAARQQDRLQPVTPVSGPPASVDWARVVISALILAFAILANVWVGFPALGVWVAIALGAAVRPTEWKLLRHAIGGSVFLLALVFCASLMPVEELPAASWPTALMLGFVSAFFDNIPLTKLALTQGGHDWAFIAYAVGFGGSMMWFGSSAGVALCNLYPEGRSFGSYARSGWHVTAGYVLGFAVMLALIGWHPRPMHALQPQPSSTLAVQVQASR